MKKFSSRIFILLFIICLCATSAAAATTLIPGGQVIGLQLQDDTVTVTDFDETLGQAARSAGLSKGDRILQIDETPITCAEDIRKALACSDGQVDISIRRGAKTKTLSLCPPLTDEGPRLGVYLRQGTTGLGTITYYDPDSGSIATLGHGVNTSDGQLLTMRNGSLFPARIFSVKKGKAGAPGQLLGSITDPTPLGTLASNTNQGVFGKTSSPISGEPLPIAKSDQVKTGSATIRSTVDGAKTQEYSVEICKIYPNTTGRTRNMLLKVTDKALLETTGGIVQGMGVSYNRDNTGNPNSLRGFQVTDP